MDAIGLIVIVAVVLAIIIALLLGRASHAAKTDAAETRPDPTARAQYSKRGH